MSYNLGQIDPEAADRSSTPIRRDEEAVAPPRRVWRTSAALLVMALFAGGLWFAYVEGARHADGTGGSGDIPLIRADTRPMKVKPAEPGGMSIPDRDMLIYGESRPTVEHLLPPPEQPMALPGAATAPPKAASSLGASADAAPPTPAPSTARRQAPARAPARTQPEQSAGRAAGEPAPSRAETGAKPASQPEKRAASGSSSARCAARGWRATNGHRIKRDNRGFARSTFGDRGPRRSRRQGRLLPYSRRGRSGTR